MNRAFFLVSFVLLPSLIFSQLDVVGVTLQVDPPFSSRDSLDYFIIEGESPLFERDIEGAALNIYGDEIEEVIFKIFQDGEDSLQIFGRIFNQPSDENTIGTFLKEIKDSPIYFSYKILAKSRIQLKSIIIFPIDIELPGLAKGLGAISGTVPKPTIISREEWGAEDSKSSYSYHPYFDKLTLHHAACCSADDIEEGKDQVYWIQDFHQNGRGWNDIGYHFLVDRGGNI